MHADHDRKMRCVESARRHVIPGRVAGFEQLGVMPVLASARGYWLRDMDGRELQDFHLNGGTFNLGHCHPELVEILRTEFSKVGVGNHHFVSCARAELAEALLATMPGMQYVVFTVSGSEAVDVAIKSTRRATARRRIVSFDVGYHGRSGFSGAAGDTDNATFFRSEMPRDFTSVPFGDVTRVEEELQRGDVAAVLVETIPATYGFVLPPPDFLPSLRALCTRYDTLLIVDEVQTGMGRSGTLWAIAQTGVQPDVLVTAKGLSGGIYPIAAALLSARAGAWLDQNGWGHVSTFGGAEVGCRVAQRSLEICSSADNLAHARRVAAHLRAGLDEMRARNSYLRAVHGIGLVMGLEFDSPSGGPDMMRALYERGLWAMFASFNSSILQFKPGFLVDIPYCDEALARLEDAMAAARRLPRGRATKLASGTDVIHANA